MTSILLLHGPNLNLLGSREPALYGAQTLAEIDQSCAAQAKAENIDFSAFQSNAENALIDKIHNSAKDGTDLILINPAAFTHTSVAIRDALLAVALPVIEVHLSNPHAREPFRQHSYISDIAKGIVCGFGADSYRLAMSAAIHFLAHNPKT